MRGGLQTHHFGSVNEFGLRPLPADYNGDGATDLGVLGRATSGCHQLDGIPVRLSRADAPAGGNVTTGAGRLRRRREGGVRPVPRFEAIWQFANDLDVYWGAPIRTVRNTFQYDLPVPLDRDGDGSSELGVFHPETGVWNFKNLRTGATESVSWGRNNREIPIGTDLVPRVIRQ